MKQSARFQIPEASYLRQRLSYDARRRCLVTAPKTVQVQECRVRHVLSVDIAWQFGTLPFEEQASASDAAGRLAALMHLCRTATVFLSTFLSFGFLR